MLYLTLFLLEQCDKVGKFLFLDNEPEEREFLVSNTETDGC